MGGILNCTCCPWGNLKGKAAGGCDFWGDKIVFGQNHLRLAIVPVGKCEAVFSVRNYVRRYSQCMSKGGVKGLVTSIGTYGYIYD